MQFNLIDDYQSENIPEQTTAQVSNANLSINFEDTFMAGQGIQVVLGSTPSYALGFTLMDTYSSTPTSLTGFVPHVDYGKIKLGLLDDYQSLSVIRVERQSVVLNPNFILTLIDEYGSALTFGATPQSATPSTSFIVHIVDDFGDTPDEWVLITEDGFIISLEPEDDEFSITVE